MTDIERAEWLADKLHNGGDYGKEAAALLVRQAKEIEALRTLVQRVAKYPANVDCAGTLLRHDVLKAAGPRETWKA